MNTSTRQSADRGDGMSQRPPRALAPDLARGAMLLPIALAHGPLFVTAVEDRPSAIDDAIHFLHMLLVSNHARPMFAFLFGYALVQLMNRRMPHGDWPGARKLLRRRGRWLMAIGLAHVLLLVPLDILAPYGLTALLVAGLLRTKDATLLWSAAVSAVPSVASMGFALWFTMSRGLTSYEAGSVTAGTRDFADLLLARVQGWPYGLFFATLALLPAALLGIWAARRTILEAPSRHRRLLVRTAVAGTAVSLLGSLPAALIQAGLWTAPSTAGLWAASLAQPVAGFCGGIGMTAVVALIAVYASRRRGPLTTAVESLGRRSLTFYLFQSAVFVALFYPYGLDLENDLGLAAAVAVAAGTWLLSIPLADAMRRLNHRGPAEILLRRLTDDSRRTER
ncbi:DUF418 domain-containing protein [Streptomonospora litoralis]|uniref:DUF418 domain-containing protein n=1 Tax=Streptomonospora litoralis TaxID=2498135 RepID=A0A4P6PYK0_9ACTN|nr:DUF418 domain-containing protein [Streptomonospora litoralis]QBI53366.1 hypothetical protein EKD16_07855 [Streptomonospora litoralis]